MISLKEPKLNNSWNNVNPHGGGGADFVTFPNSLEAFWFFTVILGDLEGAGLFNLYQHPEAPASLGLKIGPVALLNMTGKDVKTLLCI